MSTGSIIPNLSQLQDTFTTSGPKYDLAIAEIAIFSLLLVIAVPLRLIQEKRYWSWNHSFSYDVGLLLLLGVLRNYIFLMCVLRIVGNALYLVAMDNKDESLFITSSVMMGIGLSPIVFEMSQVLSRCGRANIHPGESSAFPSSYNIGLSCSRVPIAIAIALMVIGGEQVQSHPNDAGTYYKAGAVVFALTVLALCLFSLYLAFTTPTAAVGRNGKIALWLVVATIPFYGVRMADMLLDMFGIEEFNSITGSWKLLVGMSLAEECVILGLLIVASIVAQPLSGPKSDGSGYERKALMEQGVNGTQIEYSNAYPAPQMLHTPVRSYDGYEEGA